LHSFLTRAGSQLMNMKMGEQKAHIRQIPQNKI
jgi:hypothetical protein